MKKLIVIFLLFFSSEIFSQSWNGIPISGDAKNLQSNFSNKGFTFRKKDLNCYIFDGKVGGEETEVFAYVTPKTNLVTKFIIYKSKKYTWKSLLNDYENVKNIITEKYGEPKIIEYFSNPYYLGDGYELTAVSVEKCNYSAYWIEADKNTNIGLNISKYLQVKLTYENVNNIERYQKELQELNGNIY